MLSKLPISTGFTPETTMGEHASLLMKKMQQQDEIKSVLNQQMQKRQDLEERQRKEKLDHEHILNLEARHGLEQLKEKKKKDKEAEKMQMVEELKKVQ